MSTSTTTNFSTTFHHSVYIFELKKIELLPIMHFSWKTNFGEGVNLKSWGGTYFQRRRGQVYSIKNIKTLNMLQLGLCYYNGVKWRIPQTSLRVTLGNNWEMGCNQFDSPARTVPLLGYSALTVILIWY